VTFRAGWVARGVVAFAALALVAALVGVAGPRAAGAVPPSMTASPSTGLADRQRVLVRGTGFPAVQLDVIECPGAEVSTTTCGSGAPYPATVGGAAQPGALAGLLRVRRLVGSIDCGASPGACLIVVKGFVGQTYTAFATVPLTFDLSKPTISARTATVAPATSLRDLQTVRVTASGFTPDARVAAAECATPGFPTIGERCATVNLATFPHVPAVDANGNASASVIVRRLPLLGGNPVDCAMTACTLRLTAYGDASDFAQAAITFAANPPPLTPAVHGSPATNLGALAPIAVSGSGFLPGATLRVMECVAGQPVDVFGDHCSLGPRADVTTDGAGTFTTHVSVWRNIKLYVGSNAVDCASSAGTCVLAAVGVDDQTSATTPLAFDPSSPPPPPPTVSASPTQGLGAFPVVTVTGQHFAPFDTVGMAEQDTSGRIRLPSGATVGADGSFTKLATLGRTTYDRINAVLPAGDCAAAPPPCSLRVGSVSNGETVFPLTFDPNAPAPPPPVVVLTPVTTPGDEHVVVALVTGAPPDSDLVLQQCETGAGGACDLDNALGQAHTDASGRAALLLPVFSSMITQNGITRCDVSPRSCAVRLTDGDYDLLEANARIPFGSPQIVAGVGTVTEPANGTTVLDVPVTLSALSFTPVTVEYATADVTATAGIDYTAATGTITFAPLQTTATVPITVDSDTLDEPDEVVLVGFSNPTGATLGGFYGLGFGVIVDADPPSVVVPGTTTTPEGGPGTHVVDVPVVLSTASGKTVTASWHTLDGSAVAGSDYQAASGTLTLAPGETSTTVPVTIIGDAVHDPTKAMFVGITNPVNATVGGFYGLGAVMITDP
jgi:hypothetical protein